MESVTYKSLKRRIGRQMEQLVDVTTNPAYRNCTDRAQVSQRIKKAIEADFQLLRLLEESYGDNG